MTSTRDSMVAAAHHEVERQAQEVYGIRTAAHLSVADIDLGLVLDAAANHRPTDEQTTLADRHARIAALHQEIIDSHHLEPEVIAHLWHERDRLLIELGGLIAEKE
jgi:hypothetical protein